MPAELVDATQVSVVIPAFNAALHLAETLRSVLAQSSPPGEVIVVDDGSTDATTEIAHSFGARVLSVANAGPSAARNAGTKAATGEYIAFLDADDVWVPEKLATQFGALRAFRRPAFSFTDFRMFDDAGLRRCRSELTRRSAFRKSAGKIRGRSQIVMAANEKIPVLYDSYIMPSSVLVRRADALAVGGFDESLRVAEDFEFCLRLYKILPAIVIMKPLLLYRQHAAQVTTNEARMKSSLFDVAEKVAAAPDRYPPADARYLGETNYLRHLWVGMAQSRRGFFDEAVVSFKQSLAARSTAGAALALFAARACRSSAGRRTFDLVREAWKRRPGRR